MPDYPSNDPSIAKSVERSIAKDVDAFWPVVHSRSSRCQVVCEFTLEIKLIWGHDLLNQVDRFCRHSLVKVLTGNLKTHLKTCGKAVPC